MISYANLFGALASGKQFKNATLDGAAFSFTMIPVQDLATGISVTSRCVAVVPSGYMFAVDQAHLIPDTSAADTTITTAATCVIALKDEDGNVLVTKTYASTGSFAVGSLGTVNTLYQRLEEGDGLYLSVTNANTVLLPDFAIQISGTLSKIK